MVLYLSAVCGRKVFTSVLRGRLKVYNMNVKIDKLDNTD